MGARVESGERKEDGEVGPALVERKGLAGDERRGEEKGRTEKKKAQIEADKAFAPEVLLHIASENVEHDQRDEEPKVRRVDESVGEAAPEFAPAEN